MKNILHLNSYYIDNKLYSVLYKKLDNRCNQTVFVPMKLNRSEENRVELNNGQFFFRKIIKPYYKFNYWGKIRRLVKEIEELDTLKKIDFVHAHNLFNDGAIAYQLKKKYGIDYVVTIRLTDTELQYRYMLHRRPFIHKVLLNAKKIIFISKLSQDSLEEKMSKGIKEKIEGKFALLPNGLDDYWIKNLTSKRKLTKNNQFNLLFVGRIIPLKNIDLIIEACRIINNEESFKVKLTIVGGESPDDKEYYQKFLQNIKNCNFVEYLNKIGDKSTLKEVFRNSDAFVLPSRAELFGLAYLEALSQGLPIIYSWNSGISTYIDGHRLGIKLESLDEATLANALKSLYLNYDEFEIDKELIRSFDWGIISEKLYNYYFD